VPYQQPPKEENFRFILESMARTKGSLTSVFSDFASITACTYAMQTREEEYLATIKGYEREELNQFAKAMAFMVNEMNDKPFIDILGPYHCEVQSKFTRDAGGEFYTPQEVGKLMAKVGLNVKDVVEAGKPITINDPAAGSGGLILSLAEEFANAKAVDLMRVTCQDISKVGCDMAYINMTLWGIPARIIWGDTLRMTVKDQWQNIHWYRVGEPLREHVGRFKELLEVEPSKNPSTSDTSIAQTVQPDLTIHLNDAGQREWTFE